MLEQDLFDAHPIIGESEEKIELDVVLSVFDGMSCGQLALKRAGMTPRVYYASEIEKSPMHITKKNFPSTIMLGDVRTVKGEDLPHVNLLLGGSPCQGFSFAGKQLNFDDPRSKLFFEFVRLLNECKPDFFLLENVVMQQEFQDIISKHVSGKLDPGERGIQPQLVNSADCSAQNRKRLYWWGKRVGDKYIQLPIPDIEDKGIVLKDILEDLPIETELSPYMKGDYDGTPRMEKGVFNFTDQEKGLTLTAKTGHGNKYLIHRPCEIRKEWNPKITENYLQWDINETGNDSQDQRAYYEDGKHGTLMSDGGGNKAKVVTNSLKEFPEETKCHHVATATDVEGHDINKRVYADTGKSPTLHTRAGDTKVLTDVVGGRIVGRRINEVTGKKESNNTDLEYTQTLETRNDEKSGCLTTVQKDNVLVIPEATKKGYVEIEDGDCFDMSYMSSETRRGRSMKDKSNCLTAGNHGMMRYVHPTYRKLTVRECSRLQTVDDSYMEDCFDEKGNPVSDSQKFKALGNGWTVDVIVHILQGMRYIVKD